MATTVSYLDIAIVTPHPTHKLPPTLGPGKITPAILVEWEEFCELFFAKDKTLPSEHVTSVLSSFSHPSIKNWIAMNKDVLRNEDYTFGNFVQDLRKNFLDPQWINQILRNVVYARMSESETFEVYSNRVLSGNNLLAGTDNHLPKAILRDTIENHLADYLSLKIDSLSSSEREHMIGIDTFDDWLLFMRRLDDSARAELQRFKLLTRKRNNYEDHAEPLPKRPRPFPSHANNIQELKSARPPFQPIQNSASNNPPHSSFASGSNALPSSNSMYPSSKSYGRLAKLTDDERELLDLHSGCKKCRRFYVQHNSGNCPNDFPPATNYMPLTLEMAADTYRASQTPDYDAFHGIDCCSTRTSRIAPIFHWGGPTSHTSIFPPRLPRSNRPLQPPSRPQIKTYTHPTYDTEIKTSRDFSPDHRDNKSFYIPRTKAPTDFFRSFSYPSRPSHLETSVPTPQIQEITSDTGATPSLPTTSTAAAVLPSSMHTTAHTTGGLTPETEESASDVSPTAFPHIIWHAAVFGQNDFPDTVECLMDTGANFILIRPETAADLGLTPRRLHRPIPLSAALDNPHDPPKAVLDHYVNISLSSKNLRWSSLSHRAIICPNLCFPIILGLPFFVRNSITLDPSLRTAIHKPTGFDLLNENALPLPSPTKPHRLICHKLFQQQWKYCLAELNTVCKIRRERLEHNNAFETITPMNYIAAIRSKIEDLASEDANNKLANEILEEFADVFEPIPHADLLPTEVLAHIPLKDKYKPLKSRKYSVPRALRPKFKELIDLRLKQGFIQPSNSHFSSPSFVIPKSDPSALPRWVCDYRQLNENTVPDKYQMPIVEDILADCGKGKIWCTIDLTDSFYQTRMHPKDIHKTAVSTPFGSYEWRVMPQGFRNSPAIHQRRVEHALREHIGKICHIFLDDCISWATDVQDAATKIRKILMALRQAGLYVNKKKIKLFCTSVKFLGHIISQNGIEADGSKIERILKWPVPKNGKEVRQFLGLVRYIGAFLPRLAHHTEILNKLTTKTSLRYFPTWTTDHQFAFESIKQIIVSRECLTVINHATLHENKIFVTTDASDTVTGAVLSFGPTWETARPVAFDSKTMKDAELNYPVHEKEMLAIIRALRKWRNDLLGPEFYVYTDHKTLLNFNTQKDLSRRQARWMEELASFDCKFIYIKGENNSVADALSRYPFRETHTSSDAELSASRPFSSTSAAHQSILHVTKDNTHNMVAALIAREPPVPTSTAPTNESSLAINKDVIDKLKSSYLTDPWCKQLESATKGMASVTFRDGLWFLNNCLIVPAASGLREHIFRLAHDSLGHFSFFKTYKHIQESYFWPGMRKDLEEGYVPSCTECQRHKSRTSRPLGPLHPLPVPDERCDSVAMDFIGPLPNDNGFNCLLTVTDRLNSDYRFIPTTTHASAEDTATLFFNNWYCENGLPLSIISDRDKLFTSRFWAHLCLLTGLQHKYSSSYHPQTDGASERTNKTVIQMLRFHVERNQTGWVRALPLIRFQMMSSVNKSTKYTPFQL